MFFTQSKHNMCIHKFIVAESEDLTSLVNIIFIGYYLSRFSNLIKFYFNVRFPFLQYQMNVFQEVCPPEVNMPAQPCRHYWAVVETNLQDLNSIILNLWIMACIVMCYYKLLTCFNPLALLQVASLLQTASLLQIVNLLQTAYTIANCQPASISLHYCKLLICFKQLALLQVVNLLQSACIFVSC